ncbi:MAG: DNA primase [Patescibacteria group bacterium]
MVNIWEEVKERADIEMIVGQYLSLSSSGSNLKAKCPFHNDKSPSLMVSRQKQIWHCFGCGAGGDIFSFVSQIENISRGEALELIAKQVGVNIEKSNRTKSAREKVETQETEYETGLKLLAWAAELYHQILLRELDKPKSIVKEYLQQRQITHQSVLQFKLGYAPNQSTLIEYSKRNPKISLEILQKTGLIAKQEGSTVWKDKFRDRITIPLMNQKDQVVGFTGRVLLDEPNRPKYLNSPQTPWFNKSELLFGLNLARKVLYQKRELMLVEGQMDVISCFKFGLNNAIASSGTSITERQVQIIAKLVPTLILALDNDQAGQIAARKVFIMATQAGLKVNRVIIPSEFKDLDETLTAGVDPRNLRQAYFLDYYFQSKVQELQSDDAQVQKNTIQDCLELIRIQDPITQEQYLQKLSKYCGISTRSLAQTMRLQKTPEQRRSNQQSSEFNEEVTTAFLPTIQSDPKTQLLRTNLKALLAIYQNYSLKDDSEKTDEIKKLISVVWKLFSRAAILPEDLNYNLEEVLLIFHDELALIWSEQLHLKTVQRPGMVQELIKSMNSYILPHRTKLQLDFELSDILLEYDEGVHKLN